MVTAGWVHVVSIKGEGRPLPVAGRARAGHCSTEGALDKGLGLMAIPAGVRLQLSGQAVTGSPRPLRCQAWSPIYAHVAKNIHSQCDLGAKIQKKQPKYIQTKSHLVKRPETSRIRPSQGSPVF